MPVSKSPRTRIPKIGKHASGQAFIRLGGRMHYLGDYNSPTSHEKGFRLAAEFAANGNRLRVDPTAITLVELIDAYLDHCEKTYTRADGTPACTNNIVLALRDPKALYGSCPAVAFGPLALRVCLDRWERSGLRRSTCNKRLGDTKRLFKWATSREMIPVTAYQALCTVEGLRQGRCSAKESRIVNAVSEADVLTIQPHVSRTVFGMAMLQWFTGARSGEILKLRRCDINTQTDQWTAKISDHKNALKGKERVLVFGENSKRILREFFVGKSPFEYLFDPRDSERERHAACKGHRRPDQIPNEKKTKRTIGNHYTADSYRRAIERGCKKAGITPWHPHQIRHAAAMRVEEEFGLAGAAVWLGHADVSITRTYAKLRESQAIEIAQKVG